ncbi:MAG: hypothetical protein CMO30_18715 [Tistrella sp.]|jgi:hypothetical protein|uniref:Uncharacterized protein n=1 Tax=Tistrella mobilis TaxID=171437 RepID=A0A162L1F9_9PROT|nr:MULTISPECIES: hypothetical protein [Tistrella]KYO52725.1 hypothetical protein AUP44_04410 [Tistrella mobilis]MAD40118.1 hypothetical protein [Tistrella sp.]MBA77305.1 hypothetical protein [Tistrella sp.]HAE51157.1 hypothetical protein [Tistrella mobilis]|tara:strand:+ start:265 stop:615 length:351 start_codon:yes stop_codon:yes gene_type:complete
MSPNKPIRKVFTLPADVAADIERAAARWEVSEAEAIRRLLVEGLRSLGKPEVLLERCRDALAEGRSFGWILANIVDGHPRLVSYSLNDGRLVITLTGNCLVTYDEASGAWDVRRGA